MRKLLLTVLVLAALCCSVVAYEAPVDFTGMTLEQVVADFMQEHQLSENNFSISYYNTVTGESYDFNEKKFSIAASTYKLPLNMCFYEMEQAGQIDPDETFRWTGMTLRQVHEQSILHSNNEVSEAMTGYWNNYYIYKENMRKYSSIPVEEIDESYYLTNTSCTRMMMDTLKYLYANSGKFEELIGYMKQAMPGEYFKAGVQEYEIAHKYGAVNEFVNDVAIIYTPQPILLAVYTQGIYGDGVCANIARLMTNYAVWKSENNAEEAPAEEEAVEVIAPVEEEPAEEVSVETPAVQPEEEPEISVTDAPEQQEPEAVTEPEESMEVEEEPEEDPLTPEQRARKKKVITWSIVGIGSILALIITPFTLKKRI